MTGVGILPANSALNPMFHADLTKVQNFFKNLLLRMRRSDVGEKKPVISGPGASAAPTSAGTRPPPIGAANPGHASSFKC